MTNLRQLGHLEPLIEADQGRGLESRHRHLFISASLTYLQHEDRPMP